jgi:hypothetical protein
LAAALVVAGLLASGIWVPSHSGRVAHRAATGSRLGELPQAARGAVSRALGQGEPRFRARRTAGRLTLSAAAAGAGARFSRLGALIDVGGASWSIGLRAFGRGRRLVPVAPASPAAYANRVRFGRPGIDEWYAASPIGIEQGFTVPARPRGASGTPLRLDLGRLPVWARARLARDGRSLLLERRGRELVRYSGLYARDAAGHALGARIELTGGRLSLSVDDRGARYPVGIDPFVAAGNMTASDGAAHDSFGWSVAVAGDTIAVGAPDARVGAHDGQGAVYVFVKQAAGWASPETAKLTASDGVAGDDLGGNGGFTDDVAISGNTVVVGAPAPNAAFLGFPHPGAAYVFVRPPAAGAARPRVPS